MENCLEMAPKSCFFGAAKWEDGTSHSYFSGPPAAGGISLKKTRWDIPQQFGEKSLQSAGYLGAYSTTSGTLIGAVGIFTLDKTGDRSNYLSVIGFTNSTNEGDVVLLQILSPIDPNVPYVSIVVGGTNCNSLPIPNGNVAWGAQIVPSDGFPRGPFPLPSDMRTTLLGGYGNLATFCGEPMAFAIRSNFGRDTLAPVWTDQGGTQHSLISIHDITNNRLAASPNLVSYAAGSSNPVVEEVFSTPLRTENNASEDSGDKKTRESWKIFRLGLIEWIFAGKKVGKVGAVGMNQLRTW
ncbi:hypothetical protein B0H19DRAFT_1082962 [Mycena capillaripes]|nr:hypothetical protein B0H19DRAFT_1082962 [Mycena capillaripes]